MKERADGERFNRARVDGDHVVYRGKRHKLGRVQRQTAIPEAGPNRIKAQRLKLEELE